MKKKTKKKYKDGTMFVNDRTNKIFIIEGCWWNEQKQDFCYNARYVNDTEDGTLESDNKIRRYWEKRLGSEFKEIKSKIATALYSRK